MLSIRKSHPIDSQGSLPIRDLGSFIRKSVLSDADIKEHRSADKVYIGLHLPHKHHRRHRHQDRSSKKSTEEPSQESSAAPDLSTPTQRVQVLLGRDSDDNEEHKAHDLFCEMVELDTKGETAFWKETASLPCHHSEELWPQIASPRNFCLCSLTLPRIVGFQPDLVCRWIKFEEDVDEGGGRWSKPHVATLSLHSLFELRSCIMNGTVILDMDAEDLFQVIDLALDNMVAAKQLEENLKEQVHDTLLLRHQHQNERHFYRNKDDNSSKINLPIIRSFAEISRKLSEPRLNQQSNGDKEELTPVCTAQNFQESTENLEVGGGIEQSHSGMLRNASSCDLRESSSTHKLNLHFMKKIPPGAEAANILVGEVDFLNHQIIGFIRLTKATMMGDLTEVPIPTRFIFFILGPEVNQKKYHEIGRSIATLMSDEVFHDVAYHARNKNDLVAGVDEFLDQVTVLPPGEWDPSIRIEPPKSIPSQESRRTGDPPVPNGKTIIFEIEEGHHDASLLRSGRLFGGLINDVRRKIPWFLSDFKDAVHIQCFASFVFLYFACLTPIVTFGGLISDATGTNIATIESLLGAAVVGIVYAFCSGQPLLLLGMTGPLLVFEAIVYDICRENGFNFLELRWWTGLWIGTIMLSIVAFDLSGLVRYITRFTEESFAALISLIFIKEAVMKLVHVAKEDPVEIHPYVNPDYICRCVPKPENNTNATLVMLVNMTSSTLNPFNGHKVTRENCEEYGGILEGEGCKYVPNVFILSVLLFLGTFTIACTLKSFRKSNFLPAKLRTVISDFAVLIAILSMVAVDAGIGLTTPKLEVPETLKPTNPKRGWVVNPFGGNPWWLAVAAIIPASLATILMFMDQQITAVIVNRKENKLIKGHGYHLDLFVVAILIIICSTLGLPWFVSETVASINHVNSLRKESECNAPGEAPKLIGAREQRVTGIAISLMIGLSIFLTKVLNFIPLPVVYGVFLYMGVSSLQGMQLVNRALIIFMPPKYQPDYMYLRHVPTKRVHMFTGIQVLCLTILCVIKTVRVISIAFPLMVLAMCFVRKGMDWIFTQRELQWLDDIIPESHKREKEDEEKKKKNEESLKSLNDGTGTVQVPLSSGNVINIPVERIIVSTSVDSTMNISEEMAKTTIWKTIQANDSMSNLSNVDKKEESIRKRNKKQGSVSKLSSKKKIGDELLPPIPSSPVKAESKDFTSFSSGSVNRKKPSPVSFYIDEEEKEHLMPEIHFDTASDVSSKEDSSC